MIEGAQTTADTYEAIRYALKELGDHHSFFIEPEKARMWADGQRKGTGILPSPYEDYPPMIVMKVYPGSPADQAEIVEGDQIEAINGEEITEENYYSVLRAEALTLN